MRKDFIKIAEKIKNKDVKYGLGVVYDLKRGKAAELQFCSGKAETEIVENKFEVEDISEIKDYNSFFLNRTSKRKPSLYYYPYCQNISIIKIKFT